MLTRAVIGGNAILRHLEIVLSFPYPFPYSFSSLSFFLSFYQRAQISTHVTTADGNHSMKLVTMDTQVHFSYFKIRVSGAFLALSV